jgi:hypothetical protein
MIPTISNECSQFLTESNGNYLVKQLPSAYQGFSKVKVRLGKNKKGFVENFNRAFEDRRPSLHQRAIFAHANINLLQETQERTEPFYIFPIDGYSIMFNPAVTDSSTDYTEYEKLHIDGDIVSDQLKMSYQSGSLSEALRSNCEIIIYGIPYYYALRSSLIEDYALFFTP